MRTAVVNISSIYNIELDEQEYFGMSDFAIIAELEEAAKSDPAAFINTLAVTVEIHSTSEKGKEENV